VIEIDVDIKEYVKKEIDSIAFSLINSAEEDTGSLKWPSYQKNLKGKMEKSYAYNIYSGNAGIILFFIEVYKLSNKKEYINLIEKAKNGMLALCLSDKSYNYSFYKGKAGVLYTLLQIYLLNKDEKILFQIEELLNDELSTFIHSKYVNDSLFEGRAGLLVVLNYLYSVLKKVNILDLIYETVEVLISNVKLHKKGIYWMQNEHNVTQSFSYAYGTSGTVYALTEMRNIFGKEYLSFLINQATDYENIFWDEKAANWLSTGKTITSFDDFLLQKSKYVSGEISFFNEKFNDISLLKGTVGVGLTRLKSYEILKEEKSLEDILKTNEKLAIESSNTKDCSIATGISGILTFYFEAYNILCDKSYKEAAIKEINNIISIKDTTGKYQFKNDENNPFGLMDGLAGLGYVFSTFINPAVDSVILPEPGLYLNNNNNEFEPIETQNFKEYILAFNFGRLYILADLIIPEETNLYLKSNEFSEEGFLNYLLQKSIDIKCEEQMHDLIALEKNILVLKKMNKNDSNWVFQNFQKNKEAERMLNCDDHTFYKLSLKLSEDARIVQTKWDWSKVEENLKKEAEKFGIILISEGTDKVKEYICNDEMLGVLKLLVQHNTVGKVIEESVAKCKETVSLEFKNRKINTIRELIYKKILVEKLE